jgi:cytoskeletal protein CcmA (bactofilin family)
VVVEGEITGTGVLSVEGTVKGSIRLRDELIIETNATV